MLVVSGLCAADFIYGLGTMLLNIYRLIIIISGEQFSPSTAWECVTMPHVFMAKIGGQLISFLGWVRTRKVVLNRVRTKKGDEMELQKHIHVRIRVMIDRKKDNVLD